MARVIVRDGRSEQVIELVDDVAVAGRAPENRIVLNERLCSRRQFQIERTPHGYKLVDLESRNGTRLNGRYVNLALLRPGDQIHVGNHIIIFEDPNFKEPPIDAPDRMASISPTPPELAPIAKAVPQPPLSTPPPAPPLSTPPPAPPLSTPPPAPPLSTPPPMRRHPRSRQVSGAMAEQKAVRSVALVAVLLGSVALILIVANSLSKGSSGGPNGRGTSSTSGDSAAAIEDRDFRNLRDYCERNSANPAKHAEMARRCEAFMRAYPSSVWLTQVRDYLEIAHGGAAGLRRAKVTRAIMLARNALTKKEFSQALSTVNTTLERHGGDLATYDEVSALKNEILDEARDHFNTEHGRAQALAKGGDAAGARAIYESLLLKMGDVSVPELEDIRRLVREWLKTLD